MINKLHPKYKDLSDEDKETITSLHHARTMIFETAQVSVTVAKQLYPIWFKLEQVLQKIWKFESNDNYIKFWYYPYCSCPKLDNNDAYPTGYYVVNKTCPIHGGISEDSKLQ